MKIDLKKYAPPGMDTDKEKGFLAVGIMGSVFYSLGYFDDYWDSYMDLWDRSKDWNVIRPGSTIDPFWELVDNRLIGYLIVALCMFVVVGVHYAYYRQGSKSIYLMRRLPDGKYLHRTCWVLPVWWMGCCLMAGLVTLLIYFAVYVGMTPAQCLPWNYGGY